MSSYNHAKHFFRQLTLKNARVMMPRIPIKVGFSKIPEDADGQITPHYQVDKTGKRKNVWFEIIYNEDFVDANKNNLQSTGVKGLIVHELSHALNFVTDPRGYFKSPHKNKIFKGSLSNYMKTKVGSVVYRSAMQPDVSTRCYDGCKTRVVPAWTSEYWLYFCPKCGFLDSYTTGYKARTPTCEHCGNKMLFKVKLPVTLAAKLDVLVQKNPKNYNSDRELKNFITRELQKNLPIAQKNKMISILKQKK
jgi:DNA-directed RNA polymerase subunit RPC12/RpoP